MHLKDFEWVDLKLIALTTKNYFFKESSASICMLSTQVHELNESVENLTEVCFVLFFQNT